MALIAQRMQPTHIHFAMKSGAYVPQSYLPEDRKGLSNHKPKFSNRGVGLLNRLKPLTLKDLTWGEREVIVLLPIFILRQVSLYLLYLLQVQIRSLPDADKQLHTFLSYVEKAASHLRLFISCYVCRSFVSGELPTTGNLPCHKCLTLLMSGEPFFLITSWKDSQQGHLTII